MDLCFCWSIHEINTLAKNFSKSRRWSNLPVSWIATLERKKYLQGVWKIIKVFEITQDTNLFQDPWDNVPKEDCRGKTTLGFGMRVHSCISILQSERKHRNVLKFYTKYYPSVIYILLEQIQSLFLTMQSVISYSRSLNCLCKLSGLLFHPRARMQQLETLELWKAPLLSSSVRQILSSIL
jgi:hypothetical protein